MRLARLHTLLAYKWPRLRLDLLRPGYFKYCLSMAPAILGGLIVLLAVIDSYQTQTKVSHLLNGIHDGVPTSTPQLKPASDQETKTFRNAAAKLATSWETLFQTLEKTPLQDVQITAVLPDPDKDLVKISALASDLKAMLLYTRALARQPDFNQVVLLDFKLQNSPGQTVAFTVSAHWKTPHE